MSLAVTGTEKDSFVASLATLVCGDGCTAESINAVVTASGNTLPAYYAPLYASYVDKAGGLEKIYGKGPAAGGAAPAPAAAGAGAAAAAPVAAAPKEEEVDALEGGMDMFGGGGGGDY